MSEAKRSAALRNLEAAKAATATKVAAMGLWHCAQCGKSAAATVHQLRKTYCSKTCMAAGYAARMCGSRNPNYRDAAARICERCGAKYSSYNKESRYCSHTCYTEEANEAMRTSAKKDANHQLIVEALEIAGAVILDLSRALNGVPDIAIWWDGAWHLAEIKNPKTPYGRKGLNRRQAAWAEAWAAPVHILRTLEDVAAFLCGDRESLVHRAKETA